MTAFEETSIRAARDFIQTVVVVDNMASYGQTIDAVEGALAVPDDYAVETGDAPPTLSPRPTEDGPLDAAAISRAFASRGLVCAILRPTPEEKLEDAIVGAAATSDILVLDWQMNDAGELASAIISRVLERDAADEGRLRLIAIYTSVSPLSDVASSLDRRIGSLRRDGSAMVLSANDAKVILLSKHETRNAPQEAALYVTEEELPDRLITEFAKLAQGLLPNATMAAMAGLRKHTHRMLARFDASLDGPLLTHRTLLGTPLDAEEFAADMILAEIQAQVPVHAIVAEYMGAAQVREYVDHRMGEGLRPALMVGSNDVPVHALDLDKTCALIEEGVKAIAADLPMMATLNGDKSADVTKFAAKFKSDVHDRLYRLMNGNLADAKRNGTYIRA